jgi:hypothetical protein
MKLTHGHDVFIQINAREKLPSYTESKYLIAYKHILTGLKSLKMF